MGADLTVYSVPYSALVATPGSKDKRLLELIRADCWFVQDIDEMIAQQNQDCAEEERIHLTFIDAVEQFLSGQPMEGAPGFVYGYALEAVCWALGSQLDTSPVPAIRHQALDAFLQERGLPLSIGELTAAGPPVAIPEPSGFPSIGFWKPEVVMDAWVALEDVDLDQVPASFRRQLDTISRWLDEAAEHEDDCLVGFVY
jgi:hypothetical protein